jgi:hypothetical protein
LGNSNCILDGIPGASWSLNCHGGAAPFTNSGSPLASVNCSTLPASTDEVRGPAAGQ